MYTLKVSTVPMYTLNVSIVPMYTLKVSYVPMYTLKVYIVPMYTLNVYIVPMHILKVSIVPMYTLKVSIVPMYTLKVSIVPMYTVKVSIVPMYTLNVSIAPSDTMESDNNEEIDNSDNKEPDNNNSESEESVIEGMHCTKELDFKHNLFDVIETCKDMCDKFDNCGNLATFRIHPSPVGMGCTNKYIEWMRELFTGILDYFSQKYTPDAEDYISFGMLHAEHPDKGMWLFMRKYKELNVNKFIDIFCDARIQPVGNLTIWYKHKKIKEGCQTCGHA